MNHQQILEKAIQKAIDGGWLPPSHIFDKELTKETIVYRVVEGASDIAFGANVKGRIWEAGADRIDKARLIFNHDFAKALWGEDMVYFDDGSQMGTRPSYEEAGSDSSPYYVPHGKNYKYHLQMMVIAEDPIKYLGENI